MARILLLCAAVLFAVGCGEDLGGASIDSMIIDPNVVGVNTDGGMTDEHFTVTITVSGFLDEVDPAQTLVFIQEPQVDAIAGETSIAGDVITVGKIQKTWIGGLEPGVYDVGAEVHSATETVLQRNLATITIEE